MSTLIVPDVHESHDTFMTKVLPLVENAERVVFLGDWWDTFNKDKRVKEMCRLISELMTFDIEHKITWLLGNHDCHYFFSHAWFACSGYNPRTLMVVRSMLSTEERGRFKISCQVGKFLVSHAGYHPETLQYRHDTVEEQALDLAQAGAWHRLFGAGQSRGGEERWGGPTWLDWQDMVPHNTPQIVGHTFNEKVRVKSSSDGVNSYCIDTGLRHVLWTDGENIEIVEL